MGMYTLHSLCAIVARAGLFDTFNAAFFSVENELAPCWLSVGSTRVLPGFALQRFAGYAICPQDAQPAGGHARADLIALQEIRNFGGGLDLP